MNLAHQLAQLLDDEQLRVAAGALEQGALFLPIGGEPYAAVPWLPTGWWVYKLRVSAPEYFVAADSSRCSCPVGEDGGCKHCTALRCNPEAAPAHRLPRGGRRRRCGHSAR